MNSILTAISSTQQAFLDLESEITTTAVVSAGPMPLGVSQLTPTRSMNIVVLAFPNPCAEIQVSVFSWQKIDHRVLWWQSRTLILYIYVTVRKCIQHFVFTSTKPRNQQHVMLQTSSFKKNAGIHHSEIILGLMYSKSTIFDEMYFDWQTSSQPLHSDVSHSDWTVACRSVNVRCSVAYITQHKNN